ncbi:MAG: spore germination protein, partial [Clostridiales bacterium]|nr:spore germination protein [Clostridiales bacterium]
VAITAVCGFLVPAQNDSAVVIRYAMLVLGATFGGYGITLGLIGVLVHMSSLESFGYPYLSPNVPFDVEDSKDSIIRAPLWMMISRPKGMAIDEQRKDYDVPPSDDGGEVSG